MRLVVLLVTLIGCLANCETNEKQIASDQVVLVDFIYDDDANPYSMRFTNLDSMIFSTRTGKNHIDAIDKTMQRTLDSFMNIILAKKSDTLFFLPHLQVGGIYSLRFPGDSTFKTKFRYGDNQPKVFYDFVEWIQKLKKQRFLNPM